MTPIALIHNLSDLKGTCYFEFLPGGYKGQCWNEGSVFLAELTFSLIEPIIKRHEQEFDHYLFVDIRRDAWEPIITDLIALAKRCETATCVGDLAGEIEFFFETYEAEFAADFAASTHALSQLSHELAGWLREALRKHECIAILGM